MAGSRRALLEESKHSDTENQSSIPPVKRIPYNTATPAELRNGEMAENTFKTWAKIMDNVHKTKREYRLAIVKHSPSVNTQLKLWDTAYQQALCYVKYKYHKYEGYLASKWLFNKKAKHADGMDKTVLHVDELREMFDSLEIAKEPAKNPSAQRSEGQQLPRQATAGRIETRNQPVVIAPTYQNPSPEAGLEELTPTPREEESSLSDESNSRSQSHNQLARIGPRSTTGNVPDELVESLLHSNVTSSRRRRETDEERPQKPPNNRVESMSMTTDEDECKYCCPASFWKKKEESSKQTDYGSLDRRSTRRRR